MPPSQIDTELANKILTLVDAVYPISTDVALLSMLYAISSGTAPGSVAVVAGTPLAHLLNILAPFFSKTRRTPHATNRNPCESCSKSHHRCVIVSPAGDPALCERCRGRELLQCAAKKTQLDRQRHHGRSAFRNDHDTQVGVVHQGVHQQLRSGTFSEEMQLENYVVNDAVPYFAYPNDQLGSSFPTT